MVPRPLFPLVQPWQPFATKSRKADCKIEKGKQKGPQEQSEEDQPKHEQPTAEGERKEPGMRK